MAVYAGLVLVLLGLIAVVHPIRRLRITTRWRGAGVAAAGVLLVFLGWSLPVPERQAAGTTRLDEILPRYHFSEHHERHLAATPAEVWRALHEVTASDIRFFRTLTAIRRLGRPGPEDILNAPAHRPILDVALSTSFVQLASETNREIVVGTTVIAPPGAAVPRTPDEFRTLTTLGFAVAAMNFRVESRPGGGSLLTTDTRVFATDPRTRGRFARYWSLIYPGSALIRRQWLAAVDRRTRGDRGRGGDPDARELDSSLVRSARRIP
ncbi:MAG TPA: hypothetical protein VJ802_07995 [Gemmatimonadaceae bacterium]|nr:hypothetical protein [Gemmatimonadaceae bacterium]